jgi:hypothetical protein
MAFFILHQQLLERNFQQLNSTKSILGGKNRFTVSKFATKDVTAWLYLL